MAVLNQEITDRWAAYNGDSAEVLASLPDQTVGLSIYSPPFAVEGGGCLYNYSSSDRDLSNCRTYAEFFEHYAFIVEQIARLTLPGRISAVHCSDVPRDGANVAGYTDFPGDIIRLHEKFGFEYLPRICIWKEPLEVRNRTMLKSLAHRQIVEDSTKTNVACADYLIPFRRKGKNPVPVTHPVGLLGYAGSRSIPAERLPYRLGRVLPYEEARDAEDEKHMHPLQLDVIERACVLWSNPGETVLSPFMGVGSEVAGAVMNGRRGLGIELKPSYFRQACRNLQSIPEANAADGGEARQMTLGDVLAAEVPA
jgi:DNA modification methylase